MKNWELNFNAQARKRWDYKEKLDRPTTLKPGVPEPKFDIEVKETRPSMISNKKEWVAKFTDHRSGNYETFVIGQYSKKEDAISSAKEFMKDFPKNIQKREGYSSITGELGIF